VGSKSSQALNGEAKPQPGKFNNSPNPANLLKGDESFHTWSMANMSAEAMREEANEKAKPEENHAGQNPSPKDEITKQALELIAEANRIAPPQGVPSPPQRDYDWYAKIRNTSIDVLIAYVGMMDSGKGDIASRRKALRESVMAEIERRNAQHISDTMNSLDKATESLDKRMLWLTVAGVFLGLAQVVVAILPIAIEKHWFERLRQLMP
jgi:hypothetical protein